MSIDPGRLSPAEAAQTLARAGGVPIRTEHIEADVAAGAPSNADGTINLVNYAAWLVLASRASN